MTAFPDRRWGRETSPLRRPLIALSCTRPGSRLIQLLTPLDRRVLERTDGRYTVLGPVGAPVLLLTTTGAKSGLPRRQPLLFARDPDRDALVVVGSNFGGEKHPAWTANLLAHPEATVTLGGALVSVRAELLQGEEADRAYGWMVEATRTYAEYRSRTDRQIRVFRLLPR
jgi:deazaflavin-dependent oxidoreductase (nitroreductase family)